VYPNHTNPVYLEGRESVALTSRQQAEADRAAMVSAIRGAIAQAGLTQSDLAESTDITLNTLSRRLNCWSDFTWPEIASIATATGVTVVDLANSAHRIAMRNLDAVAV